MAQAAAPIAGASGGIGAEPAGLCDVSENLIFARLSHENRKTVPMALEAERYVKAVRVRAFHVRGGRSPAGRERIKSETRISPG
ncbi:MAG: hypothetical protein ACLQVN_19255 [Bryobacteraceae bacterium]